MQIQTDTDIDQNTWEQIVPILNETMLGEKDQNAVLLRFFKQQPFSHKEFKKQDRPCNPSAAMVQSLHISRSFFAL